MMKPARHVTDEVQLAQALVYFVFVGTIAVIATVFAHALSF